MSADPKPIITNAPDPVGVLVGRTPYVLTSGLAVASALACVMALAVPDAIESPAVTVGNMRGTALVLLVVTLPVLVVSAAAVARGRDMWIVGWLGAAGSIAYQSVLFLFGTPFNPFFHLYVAMLSLSMWSVVAIGAALPVDDVEKRLGAKAPKRLVTAYLLVNAALFGLLWLKATVPAVLSPMPPAFLEGSGMVTGPVQVIDFAFTLPLMVLAAWRLLRGQAWGRILSGVLLVMLAIETTSIAVDQWMGHAADPASPAASDAMTPVFAVLTVLGMVMLVLFLAGAPKRAER